MKKTKLIILIISILFPLIVTSFIAFYSYGAIGGWTKNQDKFFSKYFSNEKETPVQINDWVKFYSTEYSKNTDNITYIDPETNQALEATNGTLDLADLSIESYATLTENKDTNEDTIEYQFFIYGINYENIDPTNLYLVTVPYEESGGQNYLTWALWALEADLENDGSTGSAEQAVKRSLTTDTADTTGTSFIYPIYDNNAFDPEAEENTSHYVYSMVPNYTYQFKTYANEQEIGEVAPIPFLRIASRTALFALVEVYEDTDGIQKINTLTKGEISNIKTSTEGNDSFYNLTNLENGANKDINQAGYFAYIWPTILWQAGIALVITGLLSYLFFKIWTIEEEATTTTLKPKRRK